MLIKVYSIFDSKAQAYLQPFHAVNAAVATRLIMDALKDPNHMFAMHAADYTLFEVAEFDDNSGIYSPLSSQTNLGNLLSYLASAGGSNVQ